MEEAPVLTSEPATVFTSLSGTATFNCLATQPSIQLYKNDLPLVEETCPALVVDGVALSDRGFYHCTATNTEGMVVSPFAVLHINGIYQFLVPVLIMAPGSGPFEGLDFAEADLASTMLAAIREFIIDLNSLANGQAVGPDPNSSVIIYNIRAFNNPIVLIPNV